LRAEVFPILRVPPVLRALLRVRLSVARL